jgi:L-malate glycosyltransferase
MRRMRILVICPHPEGVAPGQRLKYEQYFDYFRENGYDITVSSFMTRRFWNIVYRDGRFLEKIFWTLWGYLVRLFDLCRLPFYDGIYTFLWVVPFGPPVFEWAFALANPNFVYDIDDMVFLKPQSRANAFMSVFKSRSRVTTLMKLAKHVITCTPVLDEFARRYNPNTTDISSTIDTMAYTPARRHVNNGPLILGWSGSHSTVKYLGLIKDVLQELNRATPFKLLVIGGPDFTIEGLNVESIPWSSASEVTDLQRIDIGLYPLPDEEWVLGKSGLKALQYMALGIPSVATAIGANFRVIEDGVSGFLVKTDEEWRAALSALIGDPALRRRIGEKARERVERYYSIRANRDTYLSVLNMVFGRSAVELPIEPPRPNASI